MSAKTKAVEVVNTAAGSPLFAGENVVYLMGISFILGSLFTVFILVLLDFMRRHNPK